MQIVSARPPWPELLGLGTTAPECVVISRRVVRARRPLRLTLLCKPGSEGWSSWCASSEPRLLAFFFFLRPNNLLKVERKVDFFRCGAASRSASVLLLTLEYRNVLVLVLRCRAGLPEFSEAWLVPSWFLEGVLSSGDTRAWPVVLWLSTTDPRCCGGASRFGPSGPKGVTCPGPDSRIGNSSSSARLGIGMGPDILPRIFDWPGLGRPALDGDFKRPPLILFLGWQMCG